MVRRPNSPSFLYSAAGSGVGACVCVCVGEGVGVGLCSIDARLRQSRRCRKICCVSSVSHSLEKQSRELKTAGLTSLHETLARRSDTSQYVSPAGEARKTRK